MTDGRLAGRVAVVTGSGEGIGRSIAQRFAEEGANILVAEINPELGEAAAAELGAITEARFVRTDVGSKADTQAMVAAAVDAWGRLDILVNNAWGAANSAGWRTRPTNSSTTASPSASAARCGRCRRHSPS